MIGWNVYACIVGLMPTALSGANYSHRVCVIRGTVKLPIARILSGW